MRRDWPKDKDAALMAHWEAGLSASEIGYRMGVTRNAVIGRVHRLRAAGVRVKVHEPRPPKERPPRPARRPREGGLIRLVKPEPLPIMVDTLEGSVHLFERTGCAWPVTSAPPHRFCNRPCEGNYCEGHKVRLIQARIEMRPRKHEVPFQ